MSHIAYSEFQLRGTEFRHNMSFLKKLAVLSINASAHNTLQITIECVNKDSSALFEVLATISDASFCRNLENLSVPTVIVVHGMKVLL